MPLGRCSNRALLLLAAAPILGSVALAGCGGAGEGEPPTGSRMDRQADAAVVEIAFEARVGDAPFDCEATYEALGTGEVALRFSDLRFYVHDLRLVDAAGAEFPVALEQDGRWQYEDVALLDFEDRSGTCQNGTQETRTVIRGKTATREFVGVRFAVGVPEALNHLDGFSAPPPLDVTSLFWTWTTGYKHLRLDAKPTDPEGDRVALHLSSSFCSGNPAKGEEAHCERANVPQVRLDDAGPGSVVVLDLGALFAGLPIGTDGGGAPGCMSEPDDPECVAWFERLGIDVETGRADPAKQIAFRAR